MKKCFLVDFAIYLDFDGLKSVEWQLIRFRVSYIETRGLKWKYKYGSKKRRRQWQ